MTHDELVRALDGIYARDMGSTSGIYDEDLRARCVAEFAYQRQFRNTWRSWLARLVREMWLSEEAIEQGYGCEDALHFLEWLEERMDTPLPA